MISLMDTIFSKIHFHIIRVQHLSLLLHPMQVYRRRKKGAKEREVNDWGKTYFLLINRQKPKENILHH